MFALPADQRSLSGKMVSDLHRLRPCRSRRHR